jgi:hypothetical protein
VHITGTRSAGTHPPAPRPTPRIPTTRPTIPPVEPTGTRHATRRLHALLTPRMRKSCTCGSSACEWCRKHGDGPAPQRGGPR